MLGRSGVIGRWVLAGVLAVAALAVGPGAAEARVFVGLNFGVPLFYPYPPPYVYAPPPVVYAPAPPPVIIQQAPATAPQHSWYYCDNPKGYYPYVAKCPAGWRAVPATPPPPPPPAP